MKHLAPSVQAVASHLLWRPMSAKEITARIGMWSTTTIKFALEELVGKGIAIRDTEPMKCGVYRCRYRRSIAARKMEAA